MKMSEIHQEIYAKTQNLTEVLGQGLGYSGDSAAKVLPKFCTPNGSPKNVLLFTINFSCFQAFQPCMTPFPITLTVPKL